jgi:hypothetical protein
MSIKVYKINKIAIFHIGIFFTKILIEWSNYQLNQLSIISYFTLVFYGIPNFITSFILISSVLSSKATYSEIVN